MSALMLLACQFQSGCDQQIFGKRPFRVDPLRLAAEASLFGDVEHLVTGILVAALRPDGLILLEVYAQIGLPYTNRLFFLRAKMHLDAADFGVVARNMLEIVQEKIAVQFTVYAREQIQVESGCHP